jgi:hypothetical protein
MRALCRQIPKVGAECLNWARSDLCGGRPAMDVPTANTTGNVCKGRTPSLQGSPGKARSPERSRHRRDSRNAQIPSVRRRLAERVKSTPSGRPGLLEEQALCAIEQSFKIIESRIRRMVRPVMCRNRLAEIPLVDLIPTRVRKRVPTRSKMMSNNGLRSREKAEVAPGRASFPFGSAPARR